MLTNSTQPPLTGKKQDPRELLNGLPGMSASFVEDFITGLEFGTFEDKYHIKWKYGNPWLYPAHEFPMLKTAVRAYLVIDLLNVEKIRLPKIEMPEAERQKGMAREKAYQEFLSRKK